MPSTNTDNIVRAGGGASGVWWYFAGRWIQKIPRSDTDSPAVGSQHFKTISTFFSREFGFWIGEGNAANPKIPVEWWQPLYFDYGDSPRSTYVTNAGTETHLNRTRPDQHWVKLLFPERYHNSKQVINDMPCGGLTGDLPIFLSLIAFSIHPHYLEMALPTLIRHDSWALHSLPHGRKYTFVSFCEDSTQC